MLDVNGNSIIQIQAVQTCLSRGCKAAHEQAYDRAREDSNQAVIFPLQPHRRQRCDILHLSIYLICAKGFSKKKAPISRGDKKIRKPFPLFKNCLFVSLQTFSTNVFAYVRVSGDAVLYCVTIRRTD